jgi:hypothetical protein
MTEYEFSQLPKDEQVLYNKAVDWVMTTRCEYCILKKTCTDDHKCIEHIVNYLRQKRGNKR